MSTNPTAGRRQRLREVALFFLTLGATAFGGPAAHIAMMEDEVVRRRHWLTRAEFLDVVGATNLIPGPNSTEIAIHLGHRRAGWLGLVTAGVCFILPSALLVTVMAWAYVQFGKLPQIEAVLYGVKPVIIGVMAQALWSLGRAAVKSWSLALTGVLVMALHYASLHELALLFGAGFAVAAARWWNRAGSKGSSARGCWLLGAVNLPAAMGAAAASVTTAPPTLSALFFFFVKIGSVLFGSGYVLLAFLRADLVERWQWLTESQLLDAVAAGQITPGPVLTAATFIGYLLLGNSGALLATVGIFLPAFFFVAISGPLIPRLRASPITAGFLDGLNVASLALMAVVSLQLSFAAMVDPIAIFLALGSAFLLVRYRINSMWLVLGGAAAGLLKAGLGF